MRPAVRAALGKAAALALAAGIALPVLAPHAAAHEVVPAVAELTLEDGRARLDIRLNAEALLAGIDLDGITDTDEAPGSADHDALRLLPPAQIEARLEVAWPELRSGVALRADGRPVPLTLDGVDGSEVGDPALYRPTRLRLSGALPTDARAITLTWGEGQGPLILRHVGVVEGFDGFLDGGDTSPAIFPGGDAGRTGWGIFADYVAAGFAHILPRGPDHILFVLGLFFLSPALKPLLWQISAFTLAHSVTLALGALGRVEVPGAIVEPLIAASIVLVAAENLVRSRLHRWRMAIVFLFGLLHGLGFASVLGGVGLPQGSFVPALLGFNLGVELGQLTVLALAVLTVGVWFGGRSWYRARIAIPASLAIAAVGAAWIVERLAG